MFEIKKTLAKLKYRNMWSQSWIAKFFIESRKSGTLFELRGSMKAAIKILNQMEGVEVASTVWVNAMEVLENDKKRMQRL